jgi:hypothetical protein
LKYGAAPGWADDTEPKVRGNYLDRVHVGLDFFDAGSQCRAPGYRTFDQMAPAKRLWGSKVEPSTTAKLFIALTVAGRPGDHRGD